MGCTEDGEVPLTHDSELCRAQLRLLLLRREVLAVTHIDAVVLIGDPEDGEVDEVVFPLDAVAGGAVIQPVEVITVLCCFVPLHVMGLLGVADEVDGHVLLGRHVARVLLHHRAPTACQGTKAVVMSKDAAPGEHRKKSCSHETLPSISQIKSFPFSRIILLLSIQFCFGESSSSAGRHQRILVKTCF